MVVVSTKSQDKQTTMKLIITLLSSMLFLGFAQAEEGKKGKAKPEKADEAKAEKKISKEDFLKKAKDAEKGAKQFAKMDKNSDGFLTGDELKKPEHKKDKPAKPEKEAPKQWYFCHKALTVHFFV